MAKNSMKDIAVSLHREIDRSSESTWESRILPEGEELTACRSVTLAGVVSLLTQIQNSVAPKQFSELIKESADRSVLALREHIDTTNMSSKIFERGPGTLAVSLETNTPGYTEMYQRSGAALLKHILAQMVLAPEDKVQRKKLETRLMPQIVINMAESALTFKDTPADTRLVVRNATVGMPIKDIARTEPHFELVIAGQAVQAGVTPDFFREISFNTAREQVVGLQQISVREYLLHILADRALRT